MVNPLLPSRTLCRGFFVGIIAIPIPKIANPERLLGMFTLNIGRLEKALK
jgi:hypothetical protein